MFQQRMGSSCCGGGDVSKHEGEVEEPSQLQQHHHPEVHRIRHIHRRTTQPCNMYETFYTMLL